MASRTKFLTVPGGQAPTKPMPFRSASDRETVNGTFTGAVQLTRGKFAIVEKSHEFTLVPWRPVIRTVQA